MCSATPSGTRPWSSEGGIMAARKITTPLTDDIVRDLKAGDAVAITGVIYQARDAAHKKLVALIEAGEPLPFELQGAGALLAKSIVGNEVIAWPELGAEAVARLEVKDFPAIVVNDCHGGALYDEGRKRYAKTV